MSKNASQVNDKYTCLHLMQLHGNITKWLAQESYKKNRKDQIPDQKGFIFNLSISRKIEKLDTVRGRVVN